MLAQADIPRFVRGWCRARNVPDELCEDLIQEAYLAHLQSNGDRVAIARAIDAYRKREYKARQTVPLSRAQRDTRGECIDPDFLAARGENGPRGDDLGLGPDRYHGDCRDDV